MNRIVLFLIVLCQSCVNIQVDFTNFLEAIEMGISKNKPVLVYGFHENAIKDELFELKIMNDKKIKDYMAKNYILYKYDYLKDKLLNQLLDLNTCNFICEFRSGRLVNIYEKSGKPDVLLYVLNREEDINVAMTRFARRDENHNLAVIELTNLFIDNYLNHSLDYISRLKENINFCPLFFNNYLYIKERKDHEFNNDSISFYLEKLSKFKTSEYLYQKEIEEVYEYFFVGTNDVNVKESSIVFNEKVLKIGDIQIYDEKTYDYVFTNKGDFPFIIYYVSTSCGCQAASWPKKPILPGQQDVIKINYSPNQLGYSDKKIRVRCNLPEQNIDLRLISNVID